MITTADDPDWYDYANQKWANAVILNYGVSNNLGKILKVPTSKSTDTDVKAMLVWIPRYEYKIEDTYGTHPDGTGGTQAKPGEIKINFIETSKTEASEGYIIHPAFWWDDNSNGERELGEELSGIWVGKFETTGDASSPTILPNLQSLCGQTVSTQFTTAKKLIETILGTRYDSHMAKNSEWGAVAYLSQSKYGKYGNPNYTGANKEVYINNSSDHYTGRSGGKPSEATYSNGSCYYDTIFDGGSGTGQCGGGATTTGNITGVYDMNGGAFEYVMGNYNGDVGSSGFPTVPELKYYDKYTSWTLEKACNNGVCYGHALSETSGWYSDYPYFVDSSLPWLVRGGDYSNRINAGVFSFSHESGSSVDGASFRIILARPLKYR